MVVNACHSRMEEKKQLRHELFGFLFVQSAISLTSCCLNQVDKSRRSPRVIRIASGHILNSNLIFDNQHEQSNTMPDAHNT